MGSKSPEGDRRGHHDDLSNSDGVNPPQGKPRGAHSSSDGDGCLGQGDGEDDDEDDDGNDSHQVTTVEAADAIEKKKRKRTKKKNKNKSKAKTVIPAQQTSPPTIALAQLFPTGEYPKGEFQAAQVDNSVGTSSIDNLARTTAAELRHDARRHWEDDGFLQDYRKAAEAHRQARQWVHDTIKPGDTLQDIAVGIEDGVRALLGNPGLGTGDCLKSGLAFPTGLCRNHEVAHYTPNPGQKDIVLLKDDVLTIDFGVHVNGWIVDSAFTLAFDPVYDNLLAAVKDATDSGVKAAGVDVRICDVSAVVQETMESYEVEIAGKTYRVKPLRDITGHNVKQYRVHGGKSVPFIKNSDQTKMEEGEVFAIETFGSTGRGRTYDDIGVYGYSLKEDAPLRVPVALSSARTLHKTIRENFGTLPFCRRYLERLGVERYLAGMNCLVANGIVEQYGQLADIKGSYSAQFEHTLLLTETHKEVFSRGQDY